MSKSIEYPPSYSEIYRDCEEGFRLQKPKALQEYITLKSRSYMEMFSPVSIMSVMDASLAFGVDGGKVEAKIVNRGLVTRTLFGFRPSDIGKKYLADVKEYTGRYRYAVIAERFQELLEFIEYDN